MQVCEARAFLLYPFPSGTISMHQAELNRAVARATGETVSAIRRLGFLLDEPLAISDPDSDDLGPLVIDWDELEAKRHGGSLWEDYDPAAV